MMFSRSLLTKLLGGALVASVVFALPARTQAATAVYLSTNGGASYSLLAPTIPGTYVLGGTFSGTLTIDQQNPLNLAKLLSSQLSVTNVSSPTSLSFVFVADAYTAPTTPPAISISSSITFLSQLGTPTTLTLQSYVAAGNVAGITAGVPDVLGALNLSPTTSQSVSAPLPDIDLQLGSIPSLSAPFTIGQKLDMTLAVGSQFNAQQDTTLTVPEPATMSIAAVSLLGFAGYGYKRRRSGVVA